MAAILAAVLLAMIVASASSCIQAICRRKDASEAAQEEENQRRPRPTSDLPSGLQASYLSPPPYEPVYDDPPPAYESIELPHTPSSGPGHISLSRRVTQPILDTEPPIPMQEFGPSHGDGCSSPPPGASNDYAVPPTVTMATDSEATTSEITPPSTSEDVVDDRNTTRMPASLEDTSKTSSTSSIAVEERQCVGDMDSGKINNSYVVDSISESM